MSNYTCSHSKYADNSGRLSAIINIPGYISLRVQHSPYKDNVYLPTPTVSFSLANLPVSINLLGEKDEKSLKQMFEIYLDTLCSALINHCFKL